MVFLQAQLPQSSTTDPYVKIHFIYISKKLTHLRNCANSVVGSCSRVGSSNKGSAFPYMQILQEHISLGVCLHRHSSFGCNCAIVQVHQRPFFFLQQRNSPLIQNFPLNIPCLEAVFQTHMVCAQVCFGETCPRHTNRQRHSFHSDQVLRHHN